jgi:hypothetical protein
MDVGRPGRKPNRKARLDFATGMKSFSIKNKEYTEGKPWTHWWSLVGKHEGLWNYTVLY